MLRVWVDMNLGGHYLTQYRHQGTASWLTPTQGASPLSDSSSECQVPSRIPQLALSCPVFYLELLSVLRGGTAGEPGTGGGGAQRARERAEAQGVGVQRGHPRLGRQMQKPRAGTGSGKRASRVVPGLKPQIPVAVAMDDG